MATPLPVTYPEVLDAIEAEPMLSVYQARRRGRHQLFGLRPVRSPIRAL